MSIEFFGTEREEIQQNKFPRLKLKAKDIIRVGIVTFDEKKIFIGAHVHVKRKGPIFFCLSTKEKKEICCTHNWEGRVPRYRIGCVVVKYDLETKDNKIKLKGYELIPWLFWESIYNKIITADKEFPINKHDLKLSCSNTDYQTIDITSCRESLWNSNETIKKKIIEEATPLFEEIKNHLASQLSPIEIKEALGLEVDKGSTIDIDLSKAIESLE